MKRPDVGIGYRAAAEVKRLFPKKKHAIRVAHGVSHRVDRLKCLGNAVVPQWAFPIFASIATLEGRYYD